MSVQRVALRTLAHGRAGDKGNNLSISVIAYNPEHFEHLVHQVTSDYCREVFSDRAITKIDRYVLPKIHAMNFVFENALDGGVNRSLHRDRHGKTLSSLLFDGLVEAPNA